MKTISQSVAKAIADLLKPRTIFAMMIYMTVCYLAIRQLPMSDIIADAFFVMMGFWFGERMARQQRENKEDREEKSNNYDSPVK